MVFCSLSDVRKGCVSGSAPGLIQTGLYSHRRKIVCLGEGGTIHVAKTSADQLISYCAADLRHLFSYTTKHVSF